jgi:hypothetical protein
MSASSTAPERRRFEVRRMTALTTLLRRLAIAGTNG